MTAPNSSPNVTTGGSTIGPLDHVALGVHDLDERIAFLTGTLGMSLKRVGKHVKTGGRIAMIADSNGFKLELIELPNDVPGFQHLAYRVDDVEAAHARLVEQGCTTIRGPHEIGAARAVTALVEDPSGLQIQVIKYAPDSPDL
jgi:catechol 2,3-dioxygenase-like lactoylglutathione lyase family enzyme